MSAVIAWALATGAITGAVWAGVLLVGHLRKLGREQLSLVDQLETRLGQLEDVERRLAEVEGRLEFTERLLIAGDRREAEPARGAGRT